MAELAPGWLPLIDPAPVDAMAARIVTGGQAFAEAALLGLARQGIDTTCPFQLLLSLRRMGARRLESLFGAGPPDPETPGGRLPVAPATILSELAEMFERLEKGDTLRVSLSRFFSEWKNLEVIRDGQIIARMRGEDLYCMGLFGVLFLLSCAAFLPDRFLFHNLIVVITLPVIDLMSVMLWVRFIQLWTGQIEKM